MNFTKFLSSPHPSHKLSPTLFWDRIPVKKSRSKTVPIRDRVFKAKVVGTEPPNGEGTANDLKFIS